MANPSDTETPLVTGFPTFTAKRMVRRILEGDPAARVYLLARTKFLSAARDFLGEPGLEALGALDRVTVLEGDVCDMDLGLAGSEYRALTHEVTSIYHIAAIHFHGATARAAERVNVEGTRAMLDLGGDCRRLRRFVHFSTAMVSGTRSGVVLEEELDEGQRFGNTFEETKWRAERLVQAAVRRLPTTVLRPGIIVGDSRTGEIDRFDGPYFFIVPLVTSSIDVALPLPGGGTAPLPLVPIDYVIDAAFTLANDPRAVGKTFHLTDPSPFAARTVFELVARRAGKKPPRGSIPHALARAVLRAPGLALGLDRLARAPIAFLDAWNQVTFYNARNALELLDGTGVRCPPFDTYVDTLVRFVREEHEARLQKQEDEAADPFY